MFFVGPGGLGGGGLLTLYTYSVTLPSYTPMQYSTDTGTKKQGYNNDKPDNVNMFPMVGAQLDCMPKKSSTSLYKNMGQDFIDRQYDW